MLARPKLMNGISKLATVDIAIKAISCAVACANTITSGKVMQMESNACEK